MGRALFPRHQLIGGAFTFMGQTLYHGNLNSDFDTDVALFWSRKCDLMPVNGLSQLGLLWRQPAPLSLKRGNHEQPTLLVRHSDPIEIRTFRFRYTAR